MAKSAHQPFETWLFTGEPLTAEQTQALRQHLRQCADCQQLETAWNGVQQAFRAAPPAEPRPGFANRWQEKQQAQRLERQRRQAWSILILTSGVIIELFLLLGAQLVDLLRNPGQILIAWVYFISRLVALSQFTHAAWETLAGINLLILVVGGIFALGSLSFWSVLWIIVYKQLSARRISL